MHISLSLEMYHIWVIRNKRSITNCKSPVVSLHYTGRVNGLSTRPLKREKIEKCTMDCAEMVVMMLRLVTKDPDCC